MANLKSKFKLCRDPEWKVSRSKLGHEPLFMDPGILHWTLGNNHRAKAGYNCIEYRLSWWGPLDYRGPEACASWAS